ncbi:MAG: hypothetical protein HKN30_06640 [Sulfitobacter sp.]|nr:hypothetical protein [Sulfitobacter sp.]
MTQLIRFALISGLLGFHSPASADEWVVGLGGSDLFDEVRAEAAAGLLEYHSDPFFERPLLSMSWLLAVQFDTTDNHFIGAGVYALRPFARRNLFVEASFAVGGYHQGTFVGKGAESLLFRSSIGVGMQLKNESRLSISLDSLLDKKFTFDNPGKEAIMLRYTRPF